MQGRRSGAVMRTRLFIERAIMGRIGRQRRCIEPSPLGVALQRDINSSASRSCFLRTSLHVVGWPLDRQVRSWRACEGGWQGKAVHPRRRTPRSMSEMMIRSVSMQCSSYSGGDHASTSNDHTHLFSVTARARPPNMHSHHTIVIRSYSLVSTSYRLSTTV